MTTISSMTRSFDAKRLLPPHEALERYFARVSLATPVTEYASLEAAARRVLARQIAADAAYPNAPRSAMDGFAVRAASTPGTLRLVGEIRIGEEPRRVLEPDEAMRIPTGGVLPQGADAVVPIEAATATDAEVRIREGVRAGDAVVARGSDMREGDVLLPPGRRIGAPELAVLATLGVVEVPVYRRPLVAVISSGDEIVAPSAHPRTGEVRDSNRYAIAASLEALGAQVRHFAIVRDVQGSLEEELRTALSVCDAAVVTGGSSVGAHDFTPEAIAALGDPGIIAHGLRVRPGKPTLLAAAGSKPIIGLPGNPLSALMMLEAVGAPIVAALTGAELSYDETEAEPTEALRAPEGWTWYVPVSLDAGRATPLPLHSFATSIAARASGYVIVEGNGQEFVASDRVRVRRFLCGGAR